MEAGNHRALARNREALADVVHHGGGGGGRQRQHPLHAHGARRLRQLQVVRTEVVAPLGDAVRLVHREQGDARAAQLVQKALVVEALRRHVQQLERPRPQPPLHLDGLVAGQGAVQPRRRDPPPLQVVDLVLHQRDERRHDHGHAVQQQRGKLVAQRLAAAGGEHGQRAAPLQQAVDDLPLARPELAQAEALLQHLAGVDGCGCVGHVALRGHGGLLRHDGPPIVRDDDRGREPPRGTGDESKQVNGVHGVKSVRKTGANAVHQGAIWQRGGSALSRRYRTRADRGRRRLSPAGRSRLVD
jgi:hypothetical protein